MIDKPGQATSQEETKDAIVGELYWLANSFEGHLRETSPDETRIPCLLALSKATGEALPELFGRVINADPPPDSQVMQQRCKSADDFRSALRLLLGLEEGFGQAQGTPMGRFTSAGPLMGYKSGDAYRKTDWKTGSQHRPVAQKHLGWVADRLLPLIHEHRIVLRQKPETPTGVKRAAADAAPESRAGPHRFLGTRHRWIASGIVALLVAAIAGTLVNGLRDGSAQTSPTAIDAQTGRLIPEPKVRPLEPGTAEIEGGRILFVCDLTRTRKCPQAGQTSPVTVHVGDLLWISVSLHDGYAVPMPLFRVSVQPTTDNGQPALQALVRWAQQPDQTCQSSAECADDSVETILSTPLVFNIAGAESAVLHYVRGSTWLSEPNKKLARLPNGIAEYPGLLMAHLGVANSVCFECRDDFQRFVQFKMRVVGDGGATSTTTASNAAPPRSRSSIAINAATGSRPHAHTSAPVNTSIVLSGGAFLAACDISAQQTCASTPHSPIKARFGDVLRVGLLLPNPSRRPSPPFYVDLLERHPTKGVLSLAAQFAWTDAHLSLCGSQAPCNVSLTSSPFKVTVRGAKLPTLSYLKGSSELDNSELRRIARLPDGVTDAPGLLLTKLGVPSSDCFDCREAFTRSIWFEARVIDVGAGSGATSSGTSAP